MYSNGTYADFFKDYFKLAARSLFKTCNNKCILATSDFTDLITVSSLDFRRSTPYSFREYFIITNILRKFKNNQTSLRGGFSIWTPSNDLNLIKVTNLLFILQISLNHPERIFQLSLASFDHFIRIDCLNTGNVYCLDYLEDVSAISLYLSYKNIVKENE